MRKIFRKIVLIVLVALFVDFTITTLAAPGIGMTFSDINVNGEDFTLWGYTGDLIYSSPVVRLADIAHIFSGTAAQFDIRIPPDDRWDFWIIRGEAYTATNTPLPVTQQRWAGFASDSSGWFSPYFDENPNQLIVVGFDGEYEPDTSLIFRVIRDADGSYFHLSDFSHILGFEMEMFSHWDITTNHSAIETLPQYSPEFLRTLIRLYEATNQWNQWIDRDYFYSPCMDENVEFLQEFTIHPLWGISLDAPLTGFMPFRQPRDGITWEWHNLYMVSYQSGIMKIAIDAEHLSRHLLVIVDTSRPVLDEIVYITENDTYIMLPFDEWRIPYRYIIEAELETENMEIIGEETEQTTEIPAEAETSHSRIWIIILATLTFFGICFGIILKSRKK